MKTLSEISDWQEMINEQLQEKVKTMSKFAQEEFKKLHPKT